MRFATTTRAAILVLAICLALGAIPAAAQTADITLYYPVAVGGPVTKIIDGFEMNEILYATNQLGGRYPADLIERVEVIRGPGSAIYGGYAELAVINVITRGADELNGAAVYGEGGFMGSDIGHANISVAAGEKVGPAKVSISVLLGRGMRSNVPFTDYYNTTFPLQDHTLDPAFVNIGFKLGELSARFIYDHYRCSNHVLPSWNIYFSRTPLQIIAIHF